MKTCPFCSNSIIPEPLLKYYLGHSRLIESIQIKHPQWSNKDQACIDCLKRLYQEFSVARNMAAGPEEPTIIAKSLNLVDSEQEVNPNAGSLIMIHGPDFGRQYPLEGGDDVFIGRSENAQVKVYGENVSRQHAKIQAKQGQYILFDLESTNGTFVNTRKISAHILKDGDLVLVGNNLLKFVFGSNTEAQYYQEMYRLATQDNLTQAYNKAFFLEKLNEEFQRSSRYQRKLSLIMLDLDHFSEINNEHGHLVGDTVLKVICKNILSNIRTEDTFGRYGGEEFALLLPEIGHDNAIKTAEKIRQLVESIPFKLEDLNLKVTLSAGCASLNKDKHKNAKELLDQADKALYEAKNAGRNRVC